MKTIIKTLAFLVAMATIGCKKEFLDAKPNDGLVVPEGLVDMQQLLDHDRFMNGGKTTYGPDPSIGIAGSDDYFCQNSTLNSMQEHDYNIAVYTWAKTIPWPSANMNWQGPYRAVFYANSALDGLTKIKPSVSEQAAYNNIKGSGLFYRAYQFYNIAQVFAPLYDPVTASNSPGIPLRLTADISEKSTRASLKETYDRIISDLNESIKLLPDKALISSRPSKPASYAMLARVYLSMADYPKAKLYCDSALQINNTLLDYNKIPATQSVPFALYNDEVLFQCVLAKANANLSTPNDTRVDTMLILKYANNDLRKKLYFKLASDGKYLVKGTYNGNAVFFTGLANDEVYLIQAECLARAGSIEMAMQSLNTLLKNRYETSSFVGITATSQQDALNKVLEERRKELVLRGQRWTDLRRLNKEGRNITVTRNINGVVYTLPPNDIRYTWTIPDDVIGLTGMAQNPR